MVIGTGKLQRKNGDIIDPADGVLKSGDYIEAINGVPAVNKKRHDSGRQQLRRRRSDAFPCEGETGEEMPVEMTAGKRPMVTSRLGLWIRDDTQGIGTMTYISTNGEFGALGTGISDSDTRNAGADLGRRII